MVLVHITAHFLFIFQDDMYFISQAAFSDAMDDYQLALAV
jgi:hypothetical protein